MDKDKNRERQDLGSKLSEKELCPEDLLAGQEQAFERDIARLKERRSDFVKVSCPACGGMNHRDEFLKLGFQYVTCQDCGTLFMNPRPTPEIMAGYYADSENYRYWAKYIFPASEESRREKIHKPWLEKVLSYCVRHNVKTGTLVEVGAGFGTFSQVAGQSRRFEKVLAVEPTPELAAACRKRGVEVIEQRIEDVDPAALPPADVVVSFEVIEHLFEPGMFLQQCLKLLRPGGLLVLSCPNGQGFDISILREHSLAVDVEHVNFFNPNSIGMLLENAGLELLEVNTPGRLDCEFVHDAVVEHGFHLADPFVKKVLVDDWDRLGWPFQKFLAQQGLSSHMWLAAKKPLDEEAEREAREVEESVALCYSTWSDSYYDDYYASGKAYPPVHTRIVRDELAALGGGSLLDAGCGPSSMLRDLGGLSLDLYGFDLTPQMVQEAKRVMTKMGVAEKNIWQGSVLVSEDFKRRGPSSGFDAAICFGVLPHIPEGADISVMSNLRNAVRPGGLVLLEARNQLFSLFTFNRYSHDFFMEELIRSQDILTGSTDEQPALREVLSELKDMFRTDLPPVRQGKQDEPGYDEVLSRTHNPLVLKEQFRQIGFANVRLLFYHYHCLPPMFENRFSEYFRRQSVNLEDPSDWRGHFMASAVIVAGERL